MAQLLISSLRELDKFARLLADLLREHGNPPLFLYGPLGSGKTALISRITNFFPGGNKAETGSPSFTICNYYPVVPKILHCDLYRCQNNMPEEIIDFMDGEKGQLMVEWAEFFPYPVKDRLDISFNVVNDNRYLEITGHGDAAFSIAYALKPLWETIAGKDSVISRDS